MDETTKRKLQPILLRQQLGEYVSEAERAFARQCWRQWPKEYSALQMKEVHPQAARRTVTSQRLAAGKRARRAGRR